MSNTEIFKQNLPIRQKGENAVEIFVKVTPKAEKNRLGGVIQTPDSKAVLRVFVTAPPEHGKVNEAVIRFLSNVFHIPKTNIVLVSGATSSFKTLCFAPLQVFEIKEIIERISQI